MRRKGLGVRGGLPALCVPRAARPGRPHNKSHAARARAAGSLPRSQGAPATAEPPSAPPSSGVRLRKGPEVRPQPLRPRGSAGQCRVLDADRARDHAGPRAETPIGPTAPEQDARACRAPRNAGVGARLPARDRFAPASRAPSLPYGPWCSPRLTTGQTGGRLGQRCLLPVACLHAGLSRGLPSKRTRTCP